MAFTAKQEASVGRLSTHDDDSLHLRRNSEHILRSTDRLDRNLDPKMLPVAGLRSAVLTEQDIKKEVTFQEILNPIYRPVVIFDLDNTVWPHTQYLLNAISLVTGIKATDEDLQACGHTRKISKWQTPEIDAIQNEIQANRHPDVNPFVNKAHQKAVETVHAAHSMGHLYAYLTGRMSEIFDITKRTIEWNGLPLDTSVQQIDARTHAEPKKGHLYCSWADPDRVDEYKNEIVVSWLQSLRSAGWLGHMIIIDDTPEAFKKEIENKDVVAIVLDGPLNHNFLPFQNEIRAENWDIIAEFLEHYHGLALRQDPSPVRVFESSQLPDVRLMVQKEASGLGYFKLEELPRKAYDFIPKTVPGCS